MSHSCLVAVGAAVVGRREESQSQRHSIVIVLVFEAVEGDFVAPNDQLELVVFEELLGLDGTVEVGTPPISIVVPDLGVVIYWVCPNQVEEQFLLLDLSKSVYSFNLLYVILRLLIVDNFGVMPP